MASGGERPDLDALRELEEVLRHFETELAGWRRRALAAEQRVAEGGGRVDASAGQPLEAENRELNQRLQQARTRVADLLDRLRFLEQQQRGNGGFE
jgi:hypothetical protein